MMMGDDDATFLPRVNFDKKFKLYYLATNAMPLKMQLHLCRRHWRVVSGPLFHCVLDIVVVFFHFSNFTQLELNAERAHDVMNLWKSKHITATVDERAQQQQPHADGTYTKCILGRVFIIHFSLFFMCRTIQKFPFVTVIKSHLHPCIALESESALVIFKFNANNVTVIKMIFMSEILCHFPRFVFWVYKTFCPTIMITYFVF